MYTAIGLFHSHLLSRAGCSFDRFRKQRAHLVGGAWGPSNIKQEVSGSGGKEQSLRVSRDAIEIMARIRKRISVVGSSQ